MPSMQVKETESTANITVRTAKKRTADLFLSWDCFIRRIRRNSQKMPEKIRKITNISVRESGHKEDKKVTGLESTGKTAVVYLSERPGSFDIMRGRYKNRMPAAAEIPMMHNSFVYFLLFICLMSLVCGLR